MATDGSPAAVIGYLSVDADQSAAVLVAAADLERRARTAAGFAGASFHVSGHGAECTVVFHFDSLSLAGDWAAGPDVAAFASEIESWVRTPLPEPIVVRETGQGRALASAVVVSRVEEGSEGWFPQWQGRMDEAQQQLPGFVGQRLQAPIPGVNPDWVTVVAFDSQDHLNAWLDSPVRRGLLVEAKGRVETMDVRPASSAFESWFADASRQGRPPPAWKLNAVVLLVLYPVVMLEILTLSKIIDPWGVALSTFIGNAVSVVATGVVLIPWASRLLNWWLVPPELLARRRTVLGVGLIAVFYAVSILVFWFITHQVQGMP